MARKVLIVDDSAINRQMLKNTLCKDYDILEAENGKDAMALLHRNYKMLSAVLLDIVMPEMDGYQVLASVRDNAVLSQIPIIMVTGSEDEDSRVKALSLGANDFILKPFNPDIVKHCLKNNIALCETASILNAIQKDKLTGLYNREAFFEKVSGMILDREPGFYVLSSFDIDNFKLINDQYGALEGDRILREIGKAVKKNADKMDGIAGRVSSDNFAVLFPADNTVTEVLQSILDKNLVLVEQQSISFSIGRYVVTDLSLPASAIYDRAFIAKQSVKGRYDEHLAYFDDTMLDKLIKEQQITGEMEMALEDNQFETWFQPQYNHVTGALLGAEALVRWRHPQRGIIPPGEFIPLFEENGFIYELDKYVWRDACRHLRKWMNEGRCPLPVSVNISRYDIFRSDLIDVLTGLIGEYDIPVDLLRLEITESAFATSSDRIVAIVRRLIELGFTVEIDDFGSGYSSLNTLKDVPAQVIKLDMKFLENSINSQRGGSILESIIRMTKWLGMTVIAEGVETKEQANYLKTIGCSYVQGYLYAKPMIDVEYEELCKGMDKEKHFLPLETIENMDNNAFWDPQSMETLIFNSYIGGACIFEYNKGEIELIRINEKYADTVCPGVSIQDVFQNSSLENMDKTNRDKLLSNIRNAIESNEESVSETVEMRLDGDNKPVYIRSAVRVIARSDNRYLLYGTVINITAQREAEKKQKEALEQMQIMMDDMPGGFARLLVGPDGDIKPQYFNKGFFKLTGMSREQIMEMYSQNPFAGVHSDDEDVVKEAIADMLKTGEAHCCRYRLRHGSGGYVCVSIFGRRIEDQMGNEFLNIYYADATEKEKESQLEFLTDNIPGGLATYLCTADRVSISYCNSGFCQLFGMTREEYRKKTADDPLTFIFEEDRGSLISQYHGLMERGTPIDCIYRIHVKGGECRWVHHRALIAYRYDEEVYVNAALLDITELQYEKERILLQEEEYRLATQHSKRTICRYDIASRTLVLDAEAAKRSSLPERIPDIPRNSIKDKLISSDTVDGCVGFFEKIISGEKECLVKFCMLIHDSWRWINAHATTVFDKNGSPVSAIISYVDATDEQEKEAVYMKWQQELQNRGEDTYLLFRCNLNRNSYYDTMEGTLLHFETEDDEQYFNDRTKEFAKQCVVREDHESYIDFVNSDVMLANYYRGKRSDKIEFRGILPDGDIHWIRLSVELIEYPDSTDIEAYMMYEDINESKMEELKTKEQAETDPLTGVLNRATFAARVNQRIAASGNEERHALIMLDIDGFKQVNDFFGHGAGDQVLIDMGNMLHKESQRGDLVGRLGGDEFVVFLSDIPDEKSAALRAQRICELTRKTFSAEVRVSGSVGVALYPYDGDSFKALYKKADDTLYYVKDTGKDNYAFYNKKIEWNNGSSEGSKRDGEIQVKPMNMRRMLIVDDSKIDCEILANQFKNDFYVEKAMDGASALMKLHHYGSAISIVLLDLMMSGMDGFEVLKKMQMNTKTNSIPVIVVSGDGCQETSLKAIRAGAADFITKPVDPDILKVRVQSAVSKAENERLRAQNSFLEFQHNEMNSYRTVLERMGTIVIVNDWTKGTFIYAPSVSNELWGRYDSRPLWRILLSDMVTDSRTVQKIQQLVHDLANERERMDSRLTVQLKSASGQKFKYEMNVYKQVNAYGLADKMIITFNRLV